jgi:4a-hydroxytetrahydrobiopterin dehydratase
MRAPGEVAMSKEGWRAFLAAEGVEDWVVLHGGATTVFHTGSVSEAIELARVITQVPEFEGSGSVLTVIGSDLTVRLTRDMWNLESRHIELARAVSAVGRQHGAVADRRVVQEVQLAIASKPDDIDLDFWRAVLGYRQNAEDNAVDPLGHGSTIWMQDLDEGKALRHAMHVDVSLSREHARDRLEAALAAGGRVVDDSNAPGTWILSDKAGNRVCIASWPDGAEPGS